MDESTRKEIERMVKQYKDLSKELEISIEEILLVIAVRELIILNEKMGIPVP